MVWAQSIQPNPNPYGLRYDGKQDQRGSKAAPVFVEAEVTSTKSKADTDRDAQEEKEKANRERSAVLKRYDPKQPEGKRCTPHHHHNYEYPPTSQQA